MIKKFSEYIAGITKKDKLAIVYHTDADGVCSAAIFTEAIKRTRKVSPIMAFSQDQGVIEIQESTIKKLKSNSITKVVILDMAVDASPAPMKKIEDFADILLVDHHITSNNINSSRTTVIKSQDISDLDPSQYCTSKLIYDLFLQLEDISDINWISAIGIIGDYGIKTWNHFLESVSKKDPQALKVLFDAEELISYAWSCDGKEGLKKAYNALCSANTPGEVVKSLEEYEHIKKEVDLFVDNREKLALFCEDINLVYYPINSKYNIKSKISNILSSKYYPEKTVVVVQPGKTKAYISARCQTGRISMDALMKECIKGLRDATGGGHIPAAGGTIRKEDTEKFKDNVCAFLIAYKV